MIYGELASVGPAPVGPPGPEIQTQTENHRPKGRIDKSSQVGK